MSAKIKKSYFEVLGLCCSSEVTLIERILKPLNGVDDISVIVPSRTVVLFHDPTIISETNIVDALNKAGLEASLKPEGNTSQNFKDRWPNISTMICGLFLGLSFFKYFYAPLGWFALSAVVIGLPQILTRAIASIRNFTLNVNILVIIAVGGTLALQDYWEAATIVFLFSISQWLESRASYKAIATMSSLTSLAPQKATIAETGEQVDVNNVAVNMVVAVKAGEAIPVDGIVVEGYCEVDEKMLTGESFPVSKEVNSTAWAGTINLNGYISVKATALAKDCVVAKMAKIVEDAHSKKSQAQRFIDSCAKYYIPVVVILSTGLAAIPAALRVDNVRDWLHLAIVVLVSTCPCALILSTPVAIFCALSKAATTGLLIKGGDYLELLAKVKTIAFDKTGTVTRGEFTVTDFKSTYNGSAVDTLLYWISSIESKSSHPLSAALIEYGRLHSVEPRPENVDNFQIFVGEGVYGKIDGNDIYIGNWKVGLRAGGGTGPTACRMKEDKTNIYTYVGATLVGIFSLSDTCRSGALEAIERLKSLGIKTAMLTGDSEAAALMTQNQLNYAFDVVHAELLPQEKTRIIQDFRKKGVTAMIGDGINDAPALATADVGISMGISGSALAMEAGDVILMSNDIQKIPESIQLARKTYRKLVENVIISITTKGAILALAFAGYPLVWAAVLTDVGTCLAVILNSMLLLQDSQNFIKGFSRSNYGTFPPSCCNKNKCPDNVERKKSKLGEYESLDTEDYSRGCCKKVTANISSSKACQRSRSPSACSSSCLTEKVTELPISQGGGCRGYNKILKVTESNNEGCDIAHLMETGSAYNGFTNIAPRSSQADLLIDTSIASENREIGGCCKQNEPKGCKSSEKKETGGCSKQNQTKCCASSEKKETDGCSKTKCCTSAEKKESDGCSKQYQAKCLKSSEIKATDGCSKTKCCMSAEKKESDAFSNQRQAKCCKSSEKKETSGCSKEYLAKCCKSSEISDCCKQYHTKCCRTRNTGCFSQSSLTQIVIE